MKNLIKNFENITLPAEKKQWIAAVGVFDGVHPGHRAIIAAARKRAEATGAGVLALTFLPHPRKLLDEKNAPALLVPEKRRVELLLDAGADFCAYIDFTRQAAAMEPEEFLSSLRDNGAFAISGICVGERWRFGCKGRGGKAELTGFCRENNWSLDTVKELEFEGVTISSTAIRQALTAGNLDHAAELWGHPAVLCGKVAHGMQIAGSKLSAPTANLVTDDLPVLPHGVYSGTAEVEGKFFPAILNIGVAPTFNVGYRRVEIHLLDFKGDLYGKEVTVTLRSFIRPERRFDSPEELKAQIAKDIAAVRLTFLK